jgi:drug/metabolite transporter (DMT)-like permease
MDKRTARVTLEYPNHDPTPEDDPRPAQSRRRNRLKVLLVMTVAVVLGALGDVSLSKGMKYIGSAHFENIYQAALAAITNIYLVAGVGLLIGFLLLYLASLSWEDLSFVLPLTAADYVLVTLLAYFLLHEDVSGLRWAGSVLVAIGIGLVARS